jgi:hypothetical protein
LIWVNKLPPAARNMIIAAFERDPTMANIERHRLISEASMPKPNSGGSALATHDDIRDTLGDVDPALILEIMSLRPTIADIEEASVLLAGDPDVYGAGEPVTGVAAAIVTILTENEEDEEPPRAG